MSDELEPVVGERSEELWSRALSAPRLRTLDSQ